MMDDMDVLGYGSELPIGKWHENYRSDSNHLSGRSWIYRTGHQNVSDAEVNEAIEGLKADPHLLGSEDYIKDLQAFGNHMEI